jgi:phosphotriesterase-related protein
MRLEPGAGIDDGDQEVYEMMLREVTEGIGKIGVPIITHTQEGQQQPQQAEMRVGEGADPSRSIIGHMDGTTEVSYHLATLRHGVTVGFDHIGLRGLVGTPPDTTAAGAG